MALVNRLEFKFTRPSGARRRWSGRTIVALEPGHLLMLLMATEHSIFVAGEHASGLTGANVRTMSRWPAKPTLPPRPTPGQCSARSSSARPDLAGGGGHADLPLVRGDGTLADIGRGPAGRICAECSRGC
jgi:hypothetical protein